MTVPQISIEDLKATVTSLSPDQYNDYHVRAFALSGAIIRKFLGNDWFNSHVLPTSKGDTFFRIENVQAPLHYRTTPEFRVLDLAELLFNLHCIEGFEAPLSGLLAGKNESTYAELDFARMLRVHEIPFRFVVPQNKKGSDFDFEIFYPDGFVVCAESKCKVELNQFNPKSVRSSLEDARKQIPKEKPGIIFVKVPQQWIESIDTVLSLHDVACEFLRATERIVSIKFYVSYLTINNVWISHRHAVKEFNNPNNKYFPNRDWDIFADHPVPASWNGMPPWWTRIMFFPEDGPRATRARITRL
jgi:hypothetical protein